MASQGEGWSGRVMSEGVGVVRQGEGVGVVRHGEG